MTLALLALYGLAPSLIVRLSPNVLDELKAVESISLLADERLLEVKNISRLGAFRSSISIIILLVLIGEKKRVLFMWSLTAIV